MANPTNKILWWALVSSVGVYVVLAHVMPATGNSGLPVSVLLPVFALMSMAVGVASMIYRRQALAGPIQSGRLDLSNPVDLQAATAPFIVSLALAEMVGVFGLVLSLVSGEPIHAVAFGAAAVFLMFLHRPTRSDLVPPMSGVQGLDATPVG